jgi:hypothetical protein
MNINLNKLKQICLSPIDDFRTLGDVQDTKDGVLIYRDNPKAKILAVAHLDSVLDLRHFYTIKERHDTYVINAQLDDRLGVFTLLDILPQLGIEYDLLLTEGEEVGHSTAAHFEASKDYKWMFSFDRRLNDVVMYEYESKELETPLKKAGFKIGLGSFSDICFLDHLGIRGFNVGTGYTGEHTGICYASMSMLVSQVQKFSKFYRDNQDVEYPYTPIPKTVSYGMPSKWYADVCYLCNKVAPRGEEINDIWVCDECMVSALQCAGCDDIVRDTDLIDNLCKYCRGEDSRYMRG